MFGKIVLMGNYSWMELEATVVFASFSMALKFIDWNCLKAGSYPRELNRETGAFIPRAFDRLQASYLILQEMFAHLNESNQAGWALWCLLC